MKRLFEKIFCLHEWEIIATCFHSTHDVNLLACKKCGKVIKREI